MVIVVMITVTGAAPRSYSTTKIVCLGVVRSTALVASELPGKIMVDLDRGNMVPRLRAKVEDIVGY